MTHQEKRAWIMLVVSAVAYAVYAGIILSRADGQPLPRCRTPARCCGRSAAAIVASIVAEIALGVVNRGVPAQGRAGPGDRRLGEHIGQSFVVIGAVAAMLMAMAGLGQVLDRQRDLPVLRPLGDPRRRHQDRRLPAELPQW